MTRSDLATRMATFIVMVVAGFFLGTYLDQRFTAPNDVEPAVTWNDSAQPGRPVPASASDDG